jgi:hypothetical protein
MGLMESNDGASVASGTHQVPDAPAAQGADAADPGPDGEGDPALVRVDGLYGNRAEGDQREAGADVA